MFEQKRLGDNGTSAAATKEFGDRGDEMHKQHDQVAHADIVPISTNVTRLGTLWDRSMRQIGNSPQTGQTEHNHGVIANNDSSEQGFIFFPQYLRAAGYQTAFVGK
jgi:hypothetical protein